MAARAKSRWADEQEESPEALAQRKREKEEKRQLKEEKLRKAAEAHSTKSGETLPESVGVNGEPDRPAKRRKTSVEPESQPLDDYQDSTLLEFPVTGFGPCRDVEQYEMLNNIEEGSYGMVSRARTKATGEVVALKRLKMDYTNDGFPVTGLREIQTLMASSHNNIVKLREVVMDSAGRE